MELFQKKVQYYDHLISQCGVSQDPAKVARMVKWPVPTFTQAVQQSLRFASYCHQCIRNFTEIVQPVYKLRGYGSKVLWTDGYQSTYDDLYWGLYTAPVLAFPHFSYFFISDTNASDTGFGVVLSKIDSEGRERVIGLLKACVQQARVWVLWDQVRAACCCGIHKRFCPYFLNHHFSLWTDIDLSFGYRVSRTQKASRLDGWNRYRSSNLILATGVERDTQMLIALLVPFDQLYGWDNHDEVIPVSTIVLSASDAELRKSQLHDHLFGPFLGPSKLIHSLTSH